MLMLPRVSKDFNRILNERAQERLKWLRHSFKEWQKHLSSIDLRNWLQGDQPLLSKYPWKVLGADFIFFNRRKYFPLGLEDLKQSSSEVLKLYCEGKLDEEDVKTFTMGDSHSYVPRKDLPRTLPWPLKSSKCATMARICPLMAKLDYINNLPTEEPGFKLWLWMTWKAQVDDMRTTKRQRDGISFTKPLVKKLISMNTMGALFKTPNILIPFNLLVETLENSDQVWHRGHKILRKVFLRAPDVFLQKLSKELFYKDKFYIGYVVHQILSQNEIDIPEPLVNHAIVQEALIRVGKRERRKLAHLDLQKYLKAYKAICFIK